VATRFTRATGDCDLRRARFLLLVLRPAALRPLLLRLAEDFRPLRRRDDFRALAELRLVARFEPPRLRPEDPDRDLFLPLFERLDFLAAAMGRLRVGKFVRTDSKIRAQQSRESPYPAHAYVATACCDYPTVRVSPCRMIQRSLGSRPAARHCSRILAGGSSIGSSVSLNVPQWAAVIIKRLSVCAVDS
jgi:hypothetical protein